MSATHVIDRRERERDRVRRKRTRKSNDKRESR